MPRQPLYLIIPVLAVIAALVLFLQRDNTGTSPSSPSVAGSGAHSPPTGSTNPTPSGATPSADRNSPPPSATGTAPSGEPARPAERR